MNTGGNVVGGLVGVMVPLTARTLGWPVALGTASLFALIGAVLWVWIRADRVIDEASSPASVIAGAAAPVVAS
jgi:ACS family glucarate transporter-like MFS transporter